MFERAIPEVLGIDDVMVCFSNILVYRKSLTEPNTILNNKYSKVSQIALPPNLEKFKKVFKFLGFHISLLGIESSENIVKALQEMSYPKNGNELPQFFGMLTFNRKIYTLRIPEGSSSRETFEQ